MPCMAPAESTESDPSAPDSTLLAPVVEWVVGPMHGFYSACYVVSSDDGYVGYAKVCTGRTRCVWTTTKGIAKIGTTGYPTLQQAVQGLNRKIEHTLESRRRRVVDRMLDALRL